MLASCVAFGAAALEAVSSRGADLSGSWKLNAALSDDAEHMLAEHQRLERERYMKWRKQQERMYPPDVPPPIEVDAPATPREPSPSRRASMKRRQESLNKMLAISDTLSIRQEGATLDIVSAVESRRVVGGARTQVSLPQGELADSNVGWDGHWFVIDRRVRGGPRVVEKFRLVPKTGQLEYQMAWSGDSEHCRHEDQARVRPGNRHAAAGQIRRRDRCAESFALTPRSNSPSPPWSRGTPSSPRAPLAAVARLLVAAERRVDVGRCAVHMDHAGAQRRATRRAFSMLPEYT